MAPFTGPDVYSNHQLDVAISEECGGSDRTLRDIKKQLRKLSLLASNGLGTWIIDKEKSAAAHDEAFRERQTELGTANRGQIELGTTDTHPTSRIPPEPSANYFKVLNQKQETSEDEDFLMNE